MCGIAGIWDFGRKLVEADLWSMTDTLSSRGPDDKGYFMGYEDGIGLGHRRLSIIDLSPRGRQPMGDADGSVIVTFNGEIYNFAEIKRELSEKGHKFTSNTDTEVIIYAYKQWGTECVSRFRGMFAFALWDKNRKKLFLYRDRLGVKPLYYYFDGRVLLFASELKALMAHPRFSKELNTNALGLYLKLGYVPSPLSIFADTNKVRPGCYVEISENRLLVEHSYWRVADYCSSNGSHLTDTQVEEELGEILRDAFAYRMVSDVPVGIFLSGGIDSSLVTAVLKREVGEDVRTFTVGFDDAQTNESHYAKAVADYLGTDHTELHCSERDAIEIVPRLGEIYDEPFADSSAVPTYLLCRATRNEVKVALSADGGDEFFCGYAHYAMFSPFWDRLSTLPNTLRRAGSMVLRQMTSGPTRAIEPFLVKTTNRFFPGLEAADFSDKLTKLSHVLRAQGIRSAYASAISVWTEEQLKYLAPSLELSHALEVFSKADCADPSMDMMMADAQTYLPDDLLVKTDRASMAVGLEVREPLLDHKLIEYAVALPSRFKRNGNITKYILRKILYKYVPQELVDRPKHGFKVPLTYWMRSPLKPLVLQTFDPDRIRRQGLFSPSYVKNMTDGFLAGERISAKKMWNLLQFELWYQTWMEK